MEADGYRWFRSGDIGQITKIGSLQIIDRKKDLWKGPNGEYVSFSKVESAVKLSPYVDLAMVYGKVGAQYPIVLVCAHPVTMKDLMAKEGVTDFETAVRAGDLKIVGEGNLR